MGAKPSYTAQVNEDKLAISRDAHIAGFMSMCANPAPFRNAGTTRIRVHSMRAKSAGRGPAAALR